MEKIRGDNICKLCNTGIKMTGAHPIMGSICALCKPEKESFLQEGLREYKKGKKDKKNKIRVRIDKNKTLTAILLFSLVIFVIVFLMRIHSFTMNLYNQEGSTSTTSDSTSSSSGTNLMGKSSASNNETKSSGSTTATSSGFFAMPLPNIDSSLKNFIGFFIIFYICLVVFTGLQFISDEPHDEEETTQATNNKQATNKTPTPSTSGSSSSSSSKPPLYNTPQDIIEAIFNYILSFFISKPNPIPEIKKVSVKPDERDLGEVFYVSDKTYTYGEARALCKKYGATLATPNQIHKAYKKGSTWCSPGWSEGQYTLFPATMKKVNEINSNDATYGTCGVPGVNGVYDPNTNNKYGVNCFRE
tara:strand:- start:2054 stop:3130 length:1077 start_codon:yes stop_codon:yes gene_type:complete